MREELTTVVSNRSAAYFDIGAYISALADAETVISLRRNWPKGHFRKAKALLGMHKAHEAAESIRLGLSFEPNNNVSFTSFPSVSPLMYHPQELLAFLNDIEKLQDKIESEKKAKSEAGPVPVSA
jgi:translocation protein SEC72